ncbi:MAG: hydantoinase/oxoprolinase family protein [Phenylobacterium sp.]|uniref:hydantoinase/oxoprolinase family protein n=1 Tax=Phenylobacterium sp. TaxID=1871053 RepID=UPI002732A57E|nr:hydantoinase/oxoprolinase family protein [Phenylobacterium sp.]MDP3749552.1 hydantoinase/oxoprolinase family protein [Phenylobacterium sp.]
MRLACDTGGTFTDLIVERDDGSVAMFKAPTTPADPIEGVIAAIGLAAAADGADLAAFLRRVDTVIHGTTHAINAIVTGRTARTAFLTTAGHPDILVLREGGRANAFDHHLAYPSPYVPRALTFELPERIDHAGRITTPLDEARTAAILDRLEQLEVEAIACCLLWSITNPAHELRVGELIASRLPGVPYTLSHQLNPSLREFRRAISTAVDASLKPLMTRYLGSLHERLKTAGFSGRLLVQTSQGGMVGADALARTPIHSLNSGPSLAPVAGRAIAAVLEESGDIIVADTGGTTYDVTLIRDGRIPMTRETWIGRPYEGLMTGFPSVDVKSVGAGGGSIAWFDEGGLLRVGPNSAGSRPGPACFGQGGLEPTLTDAAVVLGHVDPDHFLGGAIPLDAAAARAAVERIAKPAGVSIEQMALAIRRMATENMVQAIQDITVRQGIDPAAATLIGGGGAAGLNSTLIGRRLGCRRVVVPFVGPCLSAAGALLSDIRAYFRATRFSETADFPFAVVNAVLAALSAQCREFAEGAGGDPGSTTIEFHAEARYPNQVWEIDVPFQTAKFVGAADVEALRQAFHAAHRSLFGYDDPGSEVEIVTWCAAVSIDLGRSGRAVLGQRDVELARPSHHRPMWFDDDPQPVRTPVFSLSEIAAQGDLSGPLVVETPFTTIVVDLLASCRLDDRIGLIISSGGAQ